MNVLYDKSVAELVTHLRALLIGVGNLVAGIMLGWFPHWHSSASLNKISHLGLPWHVVGAAFIVCAALVAFPKTRAVGYGVTSVFYLVAGWSLAVVSIDAPQANGLVVVGVFMLATTLLCGVATAQTDRGRRDVP